MVKSWVLGAAVALGLGTAASATTIDFTGIPEGELYATYAEDGYDLAFNGVWEDDAADEVEGRCCGSTGTLTVTRSGGGLFSFQSIDVQLEYFSSAASMTVSGLLGGSTVFSDTFLTASPSYQTFLASLAGNTVDTLVLTGQRDYAGGTSFTRLVVSEVAAGVPEPATWALMIGGFGLAGATLRRKRMVAA